MVSVKDLWLVFVMAVVGECHADRHDSHTHYIPDKTKDQNLFQDKNFLRDYEHIKEDLQDIYNPDFSERLNAIDMENYYFQLHDLDSNGKLDGLEMLAAINHVTGHREKDAPSSDNADSEVPIYVQRWWNEKFEEDAKDIDRILKEEDIDQDGYLSYLEFAIGRQREFGQI